MITNDSKPRPMDMGGTHQVVLCPFDFAHTVWRVFAPSAPKEDY